MKFTGNNRSIRVGILVLLGLFAAGALGLCSRTEAAEGLSIGFGKASAGSVCADSMLLAQELSERLWLATLSTVAAARITKRRSMPQSVGQETP